MKPHTTTTRNMSYDIESRKRGPFSIFILSYELPPEPKGWVDPRAQHQAMLEKHAEKKAIARDWHKNPNRRRSVPSNCLV